MDILDMIAADPNVDSRLRDFLRKQPHPSIERGSDRHREVRDECAADDVRDGGEDALEESPETGHFPHDA